LARTVPQASERIATGTDPPNFTRVALLAAFDWGKCVMAATMSCRTTARDITQGLGQPTRVNPIASAVEHSSRLTYLDVLRKCLPVTLFTVTGVTNDHHPNS
jgi:hypothetical protein